LASPSNLARMTDSPPKYSSSPPLQIRKIHIPLPVIQGDVVFAGSDMVAHPAFNDGFIDRRHLFAQHLMSEKLIHVPGMIKTQKFPFWICPKVLRCTRDIDRSWRNQCQQHMLI